MATQTEDSAAHSRAVAHHEHGTMDSTEQQRTFVGFVRFMAWAGGLSILTVIFLALTNA